MQVAVTGGTGFLGAHVVERLIERGHEPVCLVRETSDRAHLDSLGVTQVPGSLTQSERLGRLVADADAVVHAAGAVAAWRRSGYHETNAAGTRNILGACREAGVDRFLYVSSLAAKGPSPTPDPLPATDPARPVSAYGESKLAGERAVHGHAEETGTHAVIVRPPALYGPRDRGLLGLLKAVRRGVWPALVPDDAHVSLLYGPDCAGLVADLLEAPGGGGRVRLLEPADGPPYTQAAIRESVVAALRPRRLRDLRLPAPVLSAAAGCSAFYARLTHTNVMLNPDKLRELRAKHWVADTSSLQGTAWSPTATLGDGLRSTCAWYEEEGWL